MKSMNTNYKRAVLVTIASDTADIPLCETSLDELARLLDTAGGIEIARVIQVKKKLDPRMCIGTGKAEEIRELCKNNDASLVVFDFELSPSQIRNLEEVFDGPDVIDRSMLILDIFALHAMTAEGKLQVELAQLKYTAPRLIGKGKELSRQEGRIGTRGPGESQLETDRRHLKERIRALEDQLREVEKDRITMRSAREQSGITKVAIVGYTNVGKSTLLNALTNAGVTAQDKLFATLDATTRRMTLPGGESILLTDTVGFIRKLPHHLIKAFRSTLEEVTYSDVLVIVADASDPETAEHLNVTNQLIMDLGAAGKPTLYVFNKCDLINEMSEELPFPGKDKNTGFVMISAKDEKGIRDFEEALENLISAQKKQVCLHFSYAEQGLISALYRQCKVTEIRYEDEIIVTAEMDRVQRGRYASHMR